MSTVQRILREIATKENLPVETIEKIVYSQFKFVRKVMAEGIKNKPETFKSVQLTHFGKFAPREKKLQEYKKKADAKRNNNGE